MVLGLDDAAVAWLTTPTWWASPLTFAYLLLVILLAGAWHLWICRQSARSRLAESDVALQRTASVRRSSATVCTAVPPLLLLCLRGIIFVYCLVILVWSSLLQGIGCLKYFTVWNFIALTAFFGLGTVLSYSSYGWRPPCGEHHKMAAAHQVLLTVELPMSCLVTFVVWLLLYPVEYGEDAAYAQQQDFNLASFTMHAVNVIVMLLEFCLDGLHVEPQHLGIVVTWSLTYAVFNPLQAIWTHDPVYFFMDFQLPTAPLAVLLSSLLICLLFATACALSRLKWWLAGGRPSDESLPPAPAAGKGLAEDESGTATGYVRLQGGDLSPLPWWRFGLKRGESLLPSLGGALKRAKVSSGDVPRSRSVR